MPVIYSSDDNLKRNNRSNAATINIAPGYPGFCFRHSKGSNSGNYFPSKFNYLGIFPAKFHNHIYECSDSLSFIKNVIKLEQRNHRDQMMQIKRLSKGNMTQVSLFGRIRGRLHCNKTHVNAIKNISSELIFQYSPLSNFSPF